MIENLYIYKTKTTNPYINLATEKFLLDSVSENDVILYLWQNENTVVIGRNQNVWNECRCNLLESEGGFVARRLSGGGAVFHDTGNLNFTFICYSENYNLEKQLGVIKAACRRANISAEISGRNDILLNGRKFSGNAFYNSKGKSYHHGTILISADSEKLSRYLTPPKAKLEAKGVKSVRSRIINLTELVPDLTCEKMAEYMKEAFSEVYGIESETIQIPQTDEITELAKLYGSREYLYGSTHPFSVSFEGRLSFGYINICADVRSGKIEEVKVYTDSMDWELSEKSENLLRGCIFENKAVTDALCLALPSEFHCEISDFIAQQF